MRDAQFGVPMFQEIGTAVRRAITEGAPTDDISWIGDVIRDVMSPARLQVQLAEVYRKFDLLGDFFGE